MKPVYASPREQYDAERAWAGDVWCLSNLPEFKTMARETFPDDLPVKVGEVMRRMKVLDDMCARNAKFAEYGTWLRANGLTDPTYTQGAA